ncbi:DUF6578 domain-containing protein [Streptomyces sp. NPDC019531]|uniref:DUF6578 domain-containing protein n=1 Tax=Streptomyces sp. NPDC019531 TaxID=3365062 RepID=UPI00384D74B8
MGLWQVFYEDWQMECCGTPFSVGEEVRWPLLFQAADDVLGGGWHDQLTELVGVVEQGAVRVLRDENGLVVAVSESVMGSGGAIRVGGLLTVETHGGRLPEVRGRVRGVQVVTQDFGGAGPGRRTLRSVDACPKWFSGGGGERSEAGVLVMLEV